MIYVIITIILLGIIAKIKEKNKFSIKLDKLLAIVIVPAIIYFLITAQITPYIEERFIYPIIPFIIIELLHCTEILMKIVLKKEVVLYVFAILLVIINIKTGIRETKVLYDFYEIDKIENINEIPYIYVYDEANDNRINQISKFIIYDKSYILNKAEVEEIELHNILRQVDLSNGLFIYFDCENSKKYIEAMKELKKFKKIEVLSTDSFWGEQTYYFK